MSKGKGADRRKSLFKAAPPPAAPLEPVPVNVNARRQVLLGAEQQQRTTRGMAKASREVVVEDGFKYKRRKSAAVQQQQQQQQQVGAAFGGGGGGRGGFVGVGGGGGGGRASVGGGGMHHHHQAVTAAGAAAAAGGRMSSGYHHHSHRGGGPSTSHHHQNHHHHHHHPHDGHRDHQPSAASQLPADYPGLRVHERVPEDLPEDERFQMLVSEICEYECAAERERLMREHGAVEGARMAKALESALSEFQYKVEELIVRGDVLTFDQSGSGPALREMRDAKHDAMRAVATQLEDESAQWSALEQSTVTAAGGGGGGGVGAAAAATTGVVEGAAAGAGVVVTADGGVTGEGKGPEEEDALATMKRDAEEAVEAVRSMLAAEAAAGAARASSSSSAAVFDHTRQGAQQEQHVVAAPGEVAASVEEARRKMAMQAEGLGALVEGVEALCVRAERAAEVFSKALADNDFRGLPHVDSPQALLKSLVASKK